MTARTRPRRTLAELLGPEPEQRGRGRPASPERQRLYRADAEILQAKIAAIRAAHVARDDVVRKWAEVREWMLAFVMSRLPRFLAIIGDTPANRKYLKAEFRAALEPLFATDGLPR